MFLLVFLRVQELNCTELKANFWGYRDKTSRQRDENTVLNPRGQTKRKKQHKSKDYELVENKSLFFTSCDTKIKKTSELDGVSKMKIKRHIAVENNAKFFSFQSTNAENKII